MSKLCNITPLFILLLFNFGNAQFWSFRQFLQHLTTTQTRDFVRTLSSPRLTDWGNWGPWSFCPPNSWVSGFDLKIEDSQGSGVKGSKDDTALNAIKLHCSGQDGVIVDYIYSTQGPWGYYRGDKHCDGFATGFQLRSESPQGSGYYDDCAAIDMKLRCTSHETPDNWVVGGGVHSWGDWTQEQICPPESAVCAIRTQVEESQGQDSDDTSLNNVDVKCCKLPNPLEGCKAKYNWKTVMGCWEGINNCKVSFKSGFTKRELNSQSYTGSSQFSKNLGFSMEAGLAKAGLKAGFDKEYTSTTINSKTFETIIEETTFHEREISFDLGCVGVAQELILECGIFEVATMEYRCYSG